VLGGKHAQLDEWMAGENADRLDTRVPGGADHGHFDLVVRSHLRNLDAPLAMRVEVPELSELCAASQLLVLELEDHLGRRMVGVSSQFVQVNPNRGVIGLVLAETFEFRACGNDLARANHRQRVGEVPIE
jgi:hypothetical protein